MTRKVGAGIPLSFIHPSLKFSREKKLTRIGGGEQQEQEPGPGTGGWGVFALLAGLTAGGKQKDHHPSQRPDLQERETRGGVQSAGRAMCCENG